MRGWRNTVGNLIDTFGLKKKYHRTRRVDMRVKNGGERFHRIRDFKQYAISAAFREPPSEAVQPGGGALCERLLECGLRGPRCRCSLCLPCYVSAKGRMIVRRRT